MDADLAPEDAKLVTLARAAMARAGAAAGAAVRDTDGRCYAGSTVDLAALRLSALQTAVAAATASGACALEAAVIVGDAGGTAGTDPGVAAVRELSPDAAIIITDRAGKPLS